ncbi:nif-specific transcriptional activator NifA [Rhodoferax sp. 4810]|uniref:Nif-specific regulatory protein n=1 Tax=Thiospirillum jenense TaxID=1653858 RepID=A0A839HCW0_9GAMM|nr:nif-specific transcriptional activator NifA [Thiospirillum jenense]MBB1073493.1 nif-specific transcriptional activator NifA [Rhodoferax jenense]MBB1125980.1 nif-specific transcriptional activator NifA [Thiospirillum jenense]
MSELSHILPNTASSEPRLSLLEAQLETLFDVSCVLSRSLDLRTTLYEVLKTLHDRGRLHLGMVSLIDEDTGELIVSAQYNEHATPFEKVRYQSGEGVVGRIFEMNAPWILPRINDEPRFLDRLNIYDRHLPFIGVPIRIGNEGAVGVFAAQPPVVDGLLTEHARFLEMVANLIGQAVRLSRTVEAEQTALREERDKLRRHLKGEHGFFNIIGHTQRMRFVFEQVRQVAKWSTTVLLRGESGTGKELIANAIHYNSPRGRGVFIKLNCAALPDNLLESELFGHEKGAFTGAITQRKGRFEQADGGTLFLDEIGEISPAFQAKLLRVLQEGEFERVGGNRTLKVDVRVIAATNRHLEQAVKMGEFREDLYYRLNVMPITVPPLRERIEDIPELARFLVAKIARLQGRELEMTDSALRILMQHDWPGNVRELENCMERAAVMSENGIIDQAVIQLAGLHLDIENHFNHDAVRSISNLDLQDVELDERERVISALEQAGWVQAKAARLLGMTPRQIAYRIQTLNIKVKQF